MLTPPRPPTFVTFYWSLVREIPETFRNSTEGTTFWVLSVFVPLAVWFLPAVKPVLDVPEFSRWFVAVPIAISVAYGLLKTNYERFKRLQLQYNEYIEYESARRQTDAVKAALGNYMAKFFAIQSRVLRLEAHGPLQAELGELTHLTGTFVEQHVNKGESAILRFAANSTPIDPGVEAALSVSRSHLFLFQMSAAKIAYLEGLILRVEKNAGPRLLQ